MSTTMTTRSMTTRSMTTRSLRRQWLINNRPKRSPPPPPAREIHKKKMSQNLESIIIFGMIWRVGDIGGLAWRLPDLHHEAAREIHKKKMSENFDEIIRFGKIWRKTMEDMINNYDEITERFENGRFWEYTELHYFENYREQIMNGFIDDLISHELRGGRPDGEPMMT
jgi:hypothetical protein